MSAFHNSTLLITGGTGSFGHTVLKHFLETDIGEIRIFSRDEKKQDDMRHELQARHPEAAKKVKFYIGDVRNPQAVRDAMPGVDYIFHAAALKQVPSCEFFPMEAVRTNVLGTDNVLHAAIEAGVKRVVCLSTDKAAYPINAMGISKAMMERVIYANARVAAERGREALELGSDPIQVWDAVCMGAADALEETPELLPVLKKAGVVDAGGQGLCLIFEGMLSVFRSGIVLECGLSEEEKAEETAEFFRNVAAEFDSEINFTYCTEFVVGRDPEVQKDPLDLRLFLETIGDCVVVVDDDEIIKTHVHTENPGDALQAALQYGQLLTVKIENMKEQHRKAAEENEAQKAASSQAQAQPEKAKLEPQEPTEEMGFISVAAGDGLKSLFMDLGCANVVSGGQTMNPSTEDLLEAVLATPAKKVFILPNNKNIIMAAEQTVPLATDREVIVIPTRTIPQGLSAMLAFDPDSDAETNQEAMLEAAGNVDTGLVTFAARDSEFGGHTIRHGDILGLKNGKLEYIEKDPVSACVRVARSFANKHTSFITLIYGEGITQEQAEEAKRTLESKLHSDVEITLVNGGQPVYFFIISVE
mgnify:CR=1 FL=1